MRVRVEINAQILRHALKKLMVLADWEEVLLSELLESDPKCLQVRITHYFVLFDGQLLG